MKVPIVIEETAGIDRFNEPVTVGIPFPKGVLSDDDGLTLQDERSRFLPLQTQVLDRWADRSYRWVLLDFQGTVPALQSRHYALEVRKGVLSVPSGDGVVLGESAGMLQVVTGRAEFRLSKTRLPFDQVLINNTKILANDSPGVVLRDAKDQTCKAIVSKLVVETIGPLRSTIYIEGYFFHPAEKQPLAVFFSRLHFFSGRSLVKLDFTIRNPRAAKHPRGLWDLGDAGSIFFKDLSLRLKLAGDDRSTIHWTENPSAAVKQAAGSELEIYQDSSGGENWQSRNHINRFGNVPNTFRGYRVRAASEMALQGERARPTVMLSRENRCVSASIESFWQNFPKALEASETGIVVRLFPGQYADTFELQGGEQKTHTIYLDFADGPRDALPWTHEPLVPRAQPEWYAQCGGFSYMVPEADDANRHYVELVRHAIEGDNTFFQRRETIDEYGWRHFGELYADHEAAYYSGPQPIISHYNNQYDGIQAFALHYARSGDRRWFQLMRDLARHVIDIDVYHTSEDKAAYNGGLFWHTDHYVDAATSTHRTFSRQTMKEKSLKDYGGGPSNEHLYSTGLMTYYFLTGDVQARESALGLADWVLRMDDGSLTPLRFLSRRATGLASQTGSREYHGPGRGAGNSIDALLNAHRLSGKTVYLEKAEELIHRCINPADRIDKLNLLDAERRWSYLVFLQALGKYLDYKTEWNMKDNRFHYARESLLAYARWMALHEVPYSRVLDRVEYPTETWIVHDLRKSNVFEWAARYSSVEEQQRFFDKAEFFYENCFRDLEKFPTKIYTRSIVMLLHYGAMHGYFRFHGGLRDCHRCVPRSDFGQPRLFKSQRTIIEIRLKRWGSVAAGAVIGSFAFLIF